MRNDYVLKSFAKRAASLMLCSLSIVISTLPGLIQEARANEFRLAPIQLAQSLTPEKLRVNPGEVPLTGTIQINSSIKGKLTNSDYRFEGRRYHKYQFSGEEGKLMRMTVVGANIDPNQPTTRFNINSTLVNPVLVLVAPDGQIIDQQPAENNLSFARIRMTLPATGTYSLLVTSVSPQTNGNYSLTVERLKQDGSNTVDQ
ncbi:MAG: hypothetical protein WCA35_02105 [Kovacikia sp.]